MKKKQRDGRGGPMLGRACQLTDISIAASLFSLFVIPQYKRHLAITRSDHPD